ncbi:MAG: pyrroline-5-carboxylate reductase [Lachnospiraceae bacterium]
MNTIPESKIISFIGCGNMAQAIIGGLLASGIVKPDQIIASDHSEEQREKMNKKHHIVTTASNTKAAEKADILYLCVKPNILPCVVSEIAPVVGDNTLIISIAAGQSIKKIEGYFEKPISLVRVMPNTPALVGESMSALCHNQTVTEEQKETVSCLFEQLGRSKWVAETLMDTVTGISGSSPAYVFLFIEAMADAAVKYGMPRADAYEFCAQAVLGSAKMVLETGKHPGELKDMVCSPSGTTIEAVAKLEETGFRNSIIAATSACIEKSKEMGK